MTNLETNMFKVLTCEAVCFCSTVVRFFPAPLTQIHTALILNFYQWFCKESAHRAIWVI